MPRRSRPRRSQRRKQSADSGRQWVALARSLNLAEDKRRARAGLPPRPANDLTRWQAIS